MTTPSTPQTSSSSTPAVSSTSFPQAKIAPASSVGRRVGTKLWWLTGLCFLTAIGLTLWSQKPLGPTITIRFKEGHGIQPGNRLQHHGIEVGDVTTVTLAPDAKGVIVKVMLHPQAARLAREGSQFWIVRPRFSLTKLSGLDTVVGAKYLGVQPGLDNGKAVLEFEGLETPLTYTDSEVTEIELRFREGNGLSIGDPIKHRGIAVGEVTSVVLNDDYSGVVVKARLLGGAENLARAGSQFWIERPTINASEIRGLDTILAGRFIAVHPGQKSAALQTAFDGLEQAPPAEVPEGGVEVVLEASRRGALQRGVPVLYRGMRIGHVISVGLAQDAASVEARTWIEGPYKSLIRDNSRFWMNDGFDVSIGLKGVKLSTETLSSLIIGGVSIATPPQAGVAIKTGHRFLCAEKPDDEWLQWQPRLPVGTAAALPDVPLPQPIRATLRWHEKRFGFKREQQLNGWALLLPNDKLLLPLDLLRAPEKAVDAPTFETAGESWPLTDKNVEALGQLGMLKLSHPLKADFKSGPIARMKTLKQPINVLIVTSPSEPPLTIAASRLKPTDGKWIVDSSVPLTASHHGACAVDPTDGAVVGVVLFGTTGSELVRLQD